jgi:hypothetical protein
MFKHLLYYICLTKNKNNHGNNKMGTRPNALRSTI